MQTEEGGGAPVSNFTAKSKPLSLLSQRNKGMFEIGQQLFNTLMSSVDFLKSVLVLNKGSKTPVNKLKVTIFKTGSKNI